MGRLLQGSAYTMNRSLGGTGRAGSVPSSAPPPPRNTAPSVSAQYGGDPTPSRTTPTRSSGGGGGSSSAPTPKPTPKPADTSPVGTTWVDPQGRTQTIVKSKTGTTYWRTGSTSGPTGAAPKVQTQAEKDMIEVRNLASHARSIGGEDAASSVYAAAGYTGTPDAGATDPETFNVAGAKEAFAKATSAAPQYTQYVAPPKPQDEVTPYEEDIADYQYEDEDTEDDPYSEVQPGDDEFNDIGEIDNPFDAGTDAYEIFNEMKGLFAPYLKMGAKREETLREQQKESTEFIGDQSALKDELLTRQLRSEERKKKSGIEKVRRGTKAQALALEEGRKRALRYLKGALAKRGSFGTTGTGKFSLAALTGQYDIKTAEMKGKAQDAIMDINDKFEDIVMLVQNNRLLNESEKTGLILKLNQTTANAIDAVLSDLASQELNLGTKSFDLGYQAKLSKEAQERAKKKELRDYFIRRLEAGEYVDPEQIAEVAGDDPTLLSLVEEARRTGREFDSKAVTNVYENMLGPQWATKVNPNTGNTFKYDATQEVVRLIQEEGWVLEDALNRVRAAIKASPEFAAYQASLKKTSGGSGSGGNKVEAQSYWQNKDGENIIVGEVNGEMKYWDTGSNTWQYMTAELLDEYKKAPTLSSGGSLFSEPTG